MNDIYDDLYFFFITRVHREKSHGKKRMEQENGYEGYCFFDENRMGVFVPAENASEFRESFSNVVMETGELEIGGEPVRGFRLVCGNMANDDALGPFTVLCTSFLDTEGGRRERLISDPFGWCESWKNTLGNRDLERNPYPVIAELLEIEDLMKKGYEVTWSGPARGITDIITTSPTVIRIEVKSTITRGSMCVRMSEEFQIDKADYLCFFRLEEVEAGGMSVESMIDRLTSLGADEKVLREGLMKVGLTDTGDLTRQYSLVEKFTFPVDEDFPDILKSFENGKKPERINNISYTLDLSGLRESEIPRTSP